SPERVDEDEGDERVENRLARPDPEAVGAAHISLRFRQTSIRQVRVTVTASSAVPIAAAYPLSLSSLNCRYRYVTTDSVEPDGPPFVETQMSVKTRSPLITPRTRT